jgi:hypothetical protein
MATFKQLTEEDLLVTLMGFPDHWLRNSTLRSYWLAIAVIKNYLGEPWVLEHMNPEGPTDGFLRQTEISPQLEAKRSFRVVDLAELLYNLQSVAGVSNCIDRMLQGVIEPTYAEFDLGRMLFLHAVDFRYVVPSGKKGTDYDVEISYNEGARVCADAKCKIEATQFSEKSVLNTLADARKKLPKELPSVIFLKVPPAWLPQYGEELIRLSETFLRGTGRVVSVKIYSANLVYRNGAVQHAHSFREVPNINTRFDQSLTLDIFKKPNHKRWKRILYFPEEISQ